MKIVQKFGGTSLADVVCLQRVARRIAADAKGNHLLAVVSAQGKTTDHLTSKYKELTNQIPSRESDALLATGEQTSAALLAAALNDMGVPAVSLSGAQVPIVAEGPFGDGQIRRIDPSRIYSEWSAGRVVVVTGFQGVTLHGDTITLGRGGSDTSAVALAVALSADRCMIFTDVDGVYSTDPRVEETAVRFLTITASDMLDLALAGAKVLHPKAAQMVVQYGVPTEILSSFSDVPGTRITPDAPEQFCLTASPSGDRWLVSVLFPRSSPPEQLFKVVRLFVGQGIDCRFANRILSVDLPEEPRSLIREIHRLLYS